MRVPKHGRGRLLTRGQIGNKGGGRHPQKVLDQLIEICGLAADEMLLRLNNAEVRAKLTVDELRLILKEAGAFVLPKQVQLSGPAGGPIPIESVYEQHRRSLREQLMHDAVGPEVPDSVIALTNEWLAAWGALDDARAEADAQLAAA